MDERERRAYDEFRTVPLAVREVLESHSKRELTAHNERHARNFAGRRGQSEEQIQQISSQYRKAIQSLPGYPKERPSIKEQVIYNRENRPVPKRIANLSAPFAKIGTLFVYDTPPFQTVTSYVLSGDWGATAGPEALADGSMSFDLNPGITSQGSITAFAAVGQLYAPQSDGVMFIGANPYVNWWIDIYSDDFQYAECDVDIQFCISEFDQDVHFVTNHTIDNDNVFSQSANFWLYGSNSQAGDSSWGLSGSLPLIGGHYYWCWVQLVGYANCDWDGSGGWSSSVASVWADANCSSLTIYYVPST